MFKNMRKIGLLIPLGLIACGGGGSSSIDIPLVTTETVGSEGLVLQGQEQVDTLLSAGESLVFIADDITGVVNVSTTGDSAMEVRDDTGNLVCSSLASDSPLDSCPNLSNLNPLLPETTYEITVVALSDSESSLVTLDTPLLLDSNTVFDTVAGGGSVFYLSNQITAVTVESAFGDTDLTLSSSETIPVCSTFSTIGINSCNNVDGSATTPIISDELYLIAFEGSVSSDFSLTTTSTPTLFDQGSFTGTVEQGVGTSIFVQNVSTIELFTQSGNADLLVFDTNSTESFCESRALFSSTDSCNVATGNYEIVVWGTSASSYELVVD